MAELGGPYERLWKLLSSRYGELEAVRVVVKLVGAIVDHGEQPIGQILEQMLGGVEVVPARRPRGAAGRR